MSDWSQRTQGLNNISGIDKLLEVMSMLRDPEHGCPWDLKQSFESIVPYTIEEAYEVADAIEKQDFDDVKKELGDLLFQTIFYSQLGKEQSLFNFNDIVESVCEKLIRRHPHVFSNLSVVDEAQINANWENEKAKERQSKAQGNVSVLDDIPLALPALSRSYKIQKRVSNIGFDWPDISGAIEKVAEEVEEVAEELNASNPNIDDIADELGDLYFALTNVVRHLGLKPEQVVHQANVKFEKRFRLVERFASEKDEIISNLELEQLDQLWEQAKATLKSQ